MTGTRHHRARPARRSSRCRAGRRRPAPRVAAGRPVLPARAPRTGRPRCRPACGEPARYRRAHVDLPLVRPVRDDREATASGWTKPVAATRPAVLRDRRIDRPESRWAVASYTRRDLERGRGRSRQPRLLAAAPAHAGRDRGDVPHDAETLSTSGIAGTNGGAIRSTRAPRRGASAWASPTKAFSGSTWCTRDATATPHGSRSSTANGRR